MPQYMYSCTTAVSGNISCTGTKYFEVLFNIRAPWAWYNSVRTESSGKTGLCVLENSKLDQRPLEAAYSAPALRETGKNQKQRGQKDPYARVLYSEARLSF